MRPKRSFGQHFLHDRRTIASIIGALEARADEQIWEIGPGTGRLSRRLLAAFGPARVAALERDRDMVAHLAEHVPDLTVVEGDATRADWPALVAGPAVVCGNLPYNVSTPIYFHLLLDHRTRFRRMVLMFQKEVARRLIATEGSKRYGPPSVITRVLADVGLVCKVSPSAFKPPPRVDSAVIRVDPLSEPRFGVQESEISALNRFVRSMFHARRKTIRNNLKGIATDPRAALDQAGVDPAARPEALPPEALVKLWRAVLPTPP